MRCAILADIHANLAALNAVLEDVGKKGKVDEVWCIGDVVGYGPDPGECISVLKKLDAVCVAGNHDSGAVEKIELQYFNPNAAAALEWTAEKLHPLDEYFLENLPKTVEKGNFTLAHGSPSSPLFEYLITNDSAARNFTAFTTRYCLVGHTHVPKVFMLEGGKVITMALWPDREIILGEIRMIINPGAVGQPRDGDPRASYGIYDSGDNIFRIHRVPYDIRATQDKMARAGLPASLIMRLEVGK